MNKFVADGPKGKVLMCVLEPGNLDRLKKGEPIEFSTHNLFPHGLPAQMYVGIAFSETPIADAKELRKIAEHTTDLRTAKTEKIRPHCPECKSTIEQLGIWHSEAPVWVVFCTQCGRTLGTMNRSDEIDRTKKP
jgi:Zn ribbon nucleic-acid-binding protein